MGWEVRAAAVAAGLLAAAHGYLAWLQWEDTAHLALLSGSAAILGILAAARLWWANCVESRLITGAVALGALLGHVLVAAAGLPGQTPSQSPSAIEVVIVTLSCVTLLLLVLNRASPQTASAERRRTC